MVTHGSLKIKPTKKKETFRILFLCPKRFYVGFLLTPAVLCRVLILDFFLQHFTLLSCAFIQFYYPYTRFCYTYESFIFLNLIIDVLLAYSVRCMVDYEGCTLLHSLLKYKTVCRQFLLFLVPVTIYSLRWWGGGGDMTLSRRRVCCQ